MAKTKKGKYVHKSPAIHVTVYDVQGDPLSDKLVRELEEAVQVVLLINQTPSLAVNIATT